MRRVLVLAAGLVLVALLVGLAWWLRAGTRAVGSHDTAGALDPGEAMEGSELLAPRMPAAQEAGESESPDGAARSARERAARTRSSDRAPVHGRLVLAETGEDIEGFFSVRLRTLDLLLGESLGTRADGSFAGRQAFPAARSLALVKDAEGNELVDHEAFFDPRASDPWLVPVPEARWPTLLRGRVVDRRGRPCTRARLRLVADAAEGSYGEELPDQDGRFEFRGLERGSYRLLVQGAWSSAAPRPVEVRLGPNDLGEVVFTELPSAGDLEIRLQGDDQDRRPRVRLALLSLTGEWSLGLDAQASRPDADGAFVLRVPELPAGRYELRLAPLDGTRAEPEHAEFSPPASLAFHLSGQPCTGTVFRAHDATTGDPLSGFAAFGCLGRTWDQLQARTSFREEYEIRMPPGFESWFVWASGYRVARGTFAGVAPGAVVDVPLERGWSELYQFEDAEADAPFVAEFEPFQSPPVLSGAQVLVDGVPVAESDANGLALLSTDRAPSPITFQLPGRHPVAEYRLGILRTIVMAR